MSTEKITNNMWAILAPIIARYGVEFALQLSKNIRENREATPEAWDELLLKMDIPIEDMIMQARRAAGTPGVTNNPNP